MRNQQRAFWGFLSAPLVLYLAWAAYPTISTFVISFTDWDGVTSSWSWIGAWNYRDLFADRVFFASLVNNLLWVAVFMTVPVGLGLLVALALDVRGLPGTAGLRAAFFLPMALSFIVIGVMWAWIFQPRQGLLNGLIAGVLSLLAAVGIPVDPDSAFQIAWLGEPATARWAIMVPAVWRETGYMMILFLAGLQGIDRQLLDAARVDGADGIRLLRWIILPLLRPVTAVVMIIAVADSLRVFDVVWIMTKGGPIYTTEVLSTYMYKSAFTGYQMGYGAAIAVCLFLLCTVVIAVYLRSLARSEP